jgi:hypothetical protein
MHLNVQIIDDALLKGVSRSSLGGEALDAAEAGSGGGLLTLLLSLFLSGGKMALVWDVVAQVVSSIDGPLVRSTQACLLAVNTCLCASRAHGRSAAISAPLAQAYKCFRPCACTCKIAARCLGLVPNRRPPCGSWFCSRMWRRRCAAPTSAGRHLRQRWGAAVAAQMRMQEALASCIARWCCWEAAA